MLTRNDRTVADGLSLLDSVTDLGLRHIGFKDIGADRDTLGALTGRIAAMGATSYLEVVSTGPDDCLAAARTAVDIGVDRLLGGGGEIEATLEILDGAGIEYFPFPGFPLGHPTELGGSAADVAAHCVDFMAKGCAGADLLAYRASEADPLDLVRAARGSLNGGTLIVAGSISTVRQIADLSAAGADAFTVGSAIFDGEFSPGKDTVCARIEDILAACASAA